MSLTAPGFSAPQAISSQYLTPTPPPVFSQDASGVNNLDANAALGLGGDAASDTGQALPPFEFPPSLPMAAVSDPQGPYATGSASTSMAAPARSLYAADAAVSTPMADPLGGMPSASAAPQWESAGIPAGPAAFAPAGAGISYLA